ncbi:MAG: hypothetical protein HC822_14780 [Oscillochloris sp.]|nr:hypothetical protein [Oscillochloris sp.]
MPRKLRLKQDAEPSERLLDWLRMFDVPAWLYRALQGGEEESEHPSASTEYGNMLQRLDPARFQAELYREQGGLLRDLAGLSEHAISELRASIPPPAAEQSQVTPDDAAFVLPPLDDELAPARRRKTSEIATDHPDFTLPPLDDDLISPRTQRPGSTPEKTQQSSAAKDSNMQPVADAVEPAATRQRPRRKLAAQAAQSSDPGSISRPRKRKVAPRATASGGAKAAASQPTATLADAARAAEGDPDLGKLLQLWLTLHPQGRRAALWYLAALVAEER